MFEKDGYIAHPFAGICKIVDIEEISIGQSIKSCYVLEPVANVKLVIKVPVNSEKSNLRAIITKEQAKEVVDSFHDGSEALNITGRYIYKANMPIIESADVIEIAKVSKSLMEKKNRQLEIQKKLSIDEEKLLVLTQKLLYTEIGYVLDMTNEEVAQCVVEKMQER